MANGEINIYGAIRSQTGEGKAAFASQIWDETQQKFQDEINQETANDGLVSAKVAQSFTDTEKAQARVNIGVTQAFNVSNKEAVSKFVKELYVYDDDQQSGDEYYVVWAQRNLDGVYKFQINKRRNGTPSTFLVWEKSDYTEASYIELLLQTKGFKAIVDWEAIENGATVAPDATLQSFVFDLNFSPTILSQDKLDSITQEEFDTIFNFD